MQLGQSYYYARKCARNMLDSSPLLMAYCRKLVSEESFGSIDEIVGMLAAIWNPKSGVNGMVSILEAF